MIFAIILALLTFALNLYCVDTHLKIKKGLKEKSKGIGVVVPMLVFFMIGCVVFIVICAVFG